MRTSRPARRGHISSVDGFTKFSFSKLVDGDPQAHVREPLPRPISAWLFVHFNRRSLVLILAMPNAGPWQVKFELGSSND